MADRRVTDLSYGHFGKAIYEPSRKEWVFTRQPGIRNQLRPITTPHLSISPSLRPAEPEKRPQRWSIRQQTQLLSRHHPELVPSFTLLPFLLHTSQLITSLSAVHDPVTSTLLAFGRAVDIDNQRSGARTIPIAAVAGGEAREAVRIIRVRDERAGWGGHKGVRLAMPEVRSEEEGWWVGDGASVRQICFGDGETEKTAWLAIRLPASTVILHPLYHRLPVTTGASSLSKRQHLSRIDPNHVITISISHTGGIPHSDVTFNPWCNRQCAIIDQNGQWSIWDLEGQKRKRVSYSAKARQSGHVLDRPSDGNSRKSLVGEDGWGRVCWVRDVNTLVVCTRRHLAILDLKSDPPTRLDVPDLDLARTPNWILDVKRGLVSSSHLFVVTTSQIFQLEIGGINPGIGNDNRKAGARISFSWRHFRNGDDTSLQLEILGLDDVEHVLLYSRFNKLVTAYQFSQAAEPLSTPISISDPYIFTLPQNTTTVSEDNSPNTDLSENVSISRLVLFPLKYVTRPNITPTGPGLAYIEQGVKFFKLFVLWNDLSLRSCLYASGIPNGSELLARGSVERFTIVTPPNDRPKTSGWAFKSTRVIAEEDFIVEDGAEENSEQSGVVGVRSTSTFEGIDNHSSHIGNRNIRVSQVTKGLGGAWTLNFEPIYDLAFHQDGKQRIVPSSEAKALDRDAPPQGTQLDVYQQTLEERISAKRITGFRPIETLLELYVPRSYFENIDRASLELRQFLDSIKSSRYEELDIAPATKALVPISFNFPFQRIADQEQQGNKDVNSLSELYDRLLDVWVGSLPTAAPGKLRLAKERIARRVAAELYLSSVGIALVPCEQDRTQDRNTEIPIRPRERPGDIGEGMGKERQRRESSISPQPSVQDIGSSASHSRRPCPTSDTTSPLYSYSSHASGESGTEDASCTRLRAYTSLTPQPTLPPTMASILMHWKVGSDPSSYSWNATRIALTASSDDKEPAGGGDETALHRLKRERRLLKRQRRGTVESASSSQPISVDRLWGSQPVSVPQSSQGQVDDDIAPASQIERGIFGGRSARPTNSRRKKRTAGF